MKENLAYGNFYASKESSWKGSSSSEIRNTFINNDRIIAHNIAILFRPKDCLYENSDKV